MAVFTFFNMAPNLRWPSPGKSVGGGLSSWRYSVWRTETVRKTVVSLMMLAVWVPKTHHTEPLSLLPWMPVMPRPLQVAEPARFNVVFIVRSINRQSTQ